MPQATIHRVEAGLYPFRDAEVVKESDARLDNLHAEAKRLIQDQHQICYDVAALHGQIFDNVKHTRLFHYAVLDELIKRSYEM